MPSKFALAMKKKAAVWKKAAQAEPRKGGNFGPPDVPDGQYEAIISATCGLTERGNNPGTPYVEITATISDGDQEGKEPKAFYMLDGKMPSNDPQAMPTNEERLAGDLKTLLPDIDIEGTLSENPEQIESIVEEINSRSLKVRIGVKNRIGKEGTKGAGKRFQDVYFNEILEGVIEDGQEEESNEEEGGEEVVEEDGEEIVEEEGGEEVAPVKGDTVMFKPKGAREAREFKVKTVNNGKRTVTLSDGKKQFSEISWDSIEIMES
jgi:hypothetical protein